MKKNYFYMLVAIALMAVSCTKNETPGPIASDQAITIVASVSPQSRDPQLNEEGAGNFSQGDVMTLCVTKADGNNLSMNYAYQVDEITWGKLNVSEGTGQVTFAACYPKQTLAQNGTFEFDVLKASDKDLLLSPAQAVSVGTSNAVNLNFNHALHRLDLSFTAGEGYSADDLKNLSLSVNANTVCVVDAFQGKIREVKSGKNDYTSSGANASFYLLPQATDGITLNITIAGKPQSVTLRELFQQLNKPQDTLKGGAKSTITLKVAPEKGISVEGGSIGAWEDQVTVDGEVTIG